jgi:hypothetical protein
MRKQRHLGREAIFRQMVDLQTAHRHPRMASMHVERAALKGKIATCSPIRSLRLSRPGVLIARYERPARSRPAPGTGRLSKLRSAEHQAATGDRTFRVRQFREIDRVDRDAVSAQLSLVRGYAVSITTQSSSLSKLAA